MLTIITLTTTGAEASGTVAGAAFAWMKAAATTRMANKHRACIKYTLPVQSSLGGTTFRNIIVEAIGSATGTPCSMAPVVSAAG